MFNFKEIDTIYLYDGTFNGLLTIVFDCYVEKVVPKNVYIKDSFTPSFIDSYEYKETDLEKALRIFDGISSSISYDCLFINYHAFLSEVKNKEINILKYLLYGFKVGPKIDTMLSLDPILFVQKVKKAVWYETQRLKGFVRFRQVADEFFYSEIEPDNDILELLGEHFRKRFPNQNLIINDNKRKIVFLYNKKEATIVDSKNISIPKISEQEQDYQNLWTGFCKSIAIQERKNSRLQKQYMPKRYWKYMFETEN